MLVSECGKRCESDLIDHSMPELREFGQVLAARCYEIYCKHDHVRNQISMQKHITA
jgi:hypothetical protein